MIKVSKNRENLTKMKICKIEKNLKKIENMQNRE